MMGAERYKLPTRQLALVNPRVDLTPVLKHFVTTTFVCLNHAQAMSLNHYSGTVSSYLEIHRNWRNCDAPTSNGTNTKTFTKSMALDPMNFG